jgi:mono/diheme cytochrome c family protein
MTRLTIAAAVVVLLALAGPAAAQQAAPPAPQVQQQPPQPFAPQWAMLAGWDLFGTKGCGKCHSVRGVGGVIGPDLSATSARGFFDLGAALWNHLPRMGARMREAGIERPTLTPIETGNLLAFLYTARYFDASGDVRRGEQVFTGKGCARCHSIAGSGGPGGPPLDRLRRANSPVIVAAAMWNHWPRMADAMRARNIPRPTLQDQEMLDLIAFLVATGKDTSGETQQVVPGTPERGLQLFTDKKCAVCHAIGGRGGGAAPDLGRPTQGLSLTQFATRMWNHGPTMAARMKERAIDIPQLAGQDMADILAYLYVARYFDERGDAQRGQQLVQSRGCLGCHSVHGQGGKPGADFATSTLVRTPTGLVAGMWNHSRLMEAQAERQHARWPELTGQELADMAAYFAGLPRSAPAPTTR